MTTPCAGAARAIGVAPDEAVREQRRGERAGCMLDPAALPDHIDYLYRAAWAMCGSRHDAEDLVQEVFVKVLERPRRLRAGNELGYLLRALRNTYINRLRAVSRQPPTRQLFEDDAPHQHESPVTAREIMEAIATAPLPTGTL